MGTGPAVQPDAPDRPDTARADSARIAQFRAGSLLLCAILGVMLGREAGGSPGSGWGSWSVWLFGAGVATASVSIATRGRPGVLLLLASAVLVAGGWANARLHTVASDSLLTLLPAGAVEDAPVRVRGVVVGVTPPERAARDPLVPFASVSERVDVRLTSALAGTGEDRAWRGVSGLVVVRSGAGLLDRVRVGDAVEVRGLLSTPSPGLNPGEPDWVGLARQRAVVGVLHARDPGLVRQAPVPNGVRDRWAAWRSRVLFDLRNTVLVRAGLGGVVRTPGGNAWVDPGAVYEPGAGGGRALVSAILLGVREHDTELPRAMRRVGLAHLMAISGLHLGLSVGMLLLAMRLVGDWGRWEAAVVSAAVAVYLLVLPVQVPVWRAGALVLGLALARALGRRYDGFGVLCWVGIGLLVWRPLDAYALGYQLSVGMTALLMLLPWSEGAGGWRGVLGWPWRAGSVCVKAWGVGQAAVLAHTGVLSPLAWAATLAVSGPIALLLGAGYVALGVCLVWGDGGRWLMGRVLWAGDRLSEVVLWIDSLGWSSVQTALLPGWAAVAVTLGAVAVALRPRSMERWGLLLAACALGAWGLGRAGLPARGVALEVAMVAVGDGSCYVVRSGGEAMLYDAGSMRGGMGEDELGRVLRAMGVSRVRTAVVSHANVDHYNALPALAPAVGLERALVSRGLLESARSGGVERVLFERLASAGVEVVEVGAGDSFTLGGARVEVLWPPDGAHDAIADENDTSMVVRVRVGTDAGERAALFTGDIGAGPIRELLASAGRLGRVDVLELPHHGSHNDASESLVEALAPGVVLQSTGRQRVGDRRWDDARALHGARGLAWFVSAVDGGVRARVLRDGSLHALGTRGRD
ncbi:MAG: ComEC/Rec2 family competence protein [Phycisphaerales bacterium JB040]